MLPYALTFALTCFSLGFALNILAFARAPTLADRILAVDTMMTNGIALVILYALRRDSQLSLEVAMLLALTGFVSTVAFCKFKLRGSIIE